MQTELSPSNQLAWELYSAARLPGNVGQVVWDLRTLRLTEAEAGDLAHKIEIIGFEVSRLEAEIAKQQAEEAKRNNARS